jgi:ferredoxin-NADP reductase
VSADHRGAAASVLAVAECDPPPAVVVEVKAVTPRASLMTVALRGRRLQFQPGQAVSVGLRGQSHRRAYSIACSPEWTAETGAIELLVGVNGAGEIGARLAAARPGALLDISDPVGGFTPAPAAHDGPFLFVAGGTGIAPLRALIDHLSRRGASRRVVLLYSARRCDEFAFADELRRLAAGGRLALVQTVTREAADQWGGVRGRLEQAHLEAALTDPIATACVVCGPLSFVRDSVASLARLGVPDAMIALEGWVRQTLGTCGHFSRPRS